MHFKHRPKSRLINITELPKLIIARILTHCGKNEMVSLYGSSSIFRSFILNNYRQINAFPIYENQWTAARSIYDLYLKGSSYVLLNAQPQSGKTGACQALCYLIRNSNLGIKNYYFACGMNDNELKRQQQFEFEGLIPKENILFSKDMQRYKSDDFFENSLIILDESHYAQNGDETTNLHSSMIHRFTWLHAGVSMDGLVKKWKGKNNLVLSVSATPMSELAHFLEEDIPKGRVLLEAGKDYYGFEQMFETNSIHEAFNLGLDRERNKFATILKNCYQEQATHGKYKYAIIRFSNNGKGEEYHEAMKALLNFPIDYINFHSNEMKCRDINKIVDQEPTKFTVIEVYHSLRAGIQLNTKNICLVHDTPTAKTDVTAQGLAGRCCGYFKMDHQVQVYCNRQGLKDYLQLILNEFAPEYVPNNCTNVKQGYLAEPTSKFESYIPQAGKMPDELITRLLEYRTNHSARYPKFWELFNDELACLPFINFDLWTKTVETGIIILDEHNKSSGKSNTWEKFWNPALKAFKAKRKGAYFRNVSLSDEHDHFKYVFINLKKDHPDFGYLIMTAQSRLSSDSDKYIRTTGKELFNPKNNIDLVDELASSINTNHNFFKITWNSKKDINLIPSSTLPPQSAPSDKSSLIFKKREAKIQNLEAESSNDSYQIKPRRKLFLKLE